MNTLDLVALIKSLYGTVDAPTYLYKVNPKEWYELYSLALEHKVDVLLYTQLCRHETLLELIPSSIRRAFRSVYKYNYNQNLYGIKEANRIAQACYTAGIRICAKRGITLLNDVYPDYGVRSLQDIDFIVSPKDYLAANRLLQSLGYQILRINDQLSTCPPDNIEVNSALYKRQKHYRDCDMKLNVDIQFHSEFFNLSSMIDNSAPPTSHIKWRPLRVEDSFLLLCQGLYDDAVERNSKPGPEHCSIGKLIDLIGYTRIHTMSMTDHLQYNAVVDYACSCVRSIWNITLLKGEM